jgi:integrase
MQLYDHQGKRLYLTADERRAFIAAAVIADRPVRTLCTVLHDTGCRISEALALTPEHIDLSGSSPERKVSDQVQASSIYRAVPVPPTLRHPRHGPWHPGGSETRRRTIRPSALVLGTQHRVAARQSRDGECRNTGRPSPLAQGTAPRYGVHAISSGVPLNMPSKWMGHATLEVTAIYANALGAEEQGIAARMWDQKLPYI